MGDVVKLGYRNNTQNPLDVFTDCKTYTLSFREFLLQFSKTPVMQQIYQDDPERAHFTVNIISGIGEGECFRIQIVTLAKDEQL